MTAFSRSTAIYIIAICGFFTSASAAELKVQYQQKLLSTIYLPDGERLDKFYTKEQLPIKDADWQTALLTNPARQAQFESEAISLKSKLSSLENRWLLNDEPELVESIRQLKHELFQINVTGRIPAQLDPDLIRLRAEYNRPLVGRYTLYMGRHTDDLYLVGLINGKSTAKLHSGWSVENYIADVNHLAGADLSYGYLIHGNGEWQKVPLAYWNKKHIEPSAGSTLFVGFNMSVLPDDIFDLNEQIAAYISNRIPQ